MDVNKADAMNRTPLFAAAMNGRAGVVKQLLFVGGGADPSIRAGGSGPTAFEAARDCGFAEVAQLLQNPTTAAAAATASADLSPFPMGTKVEIAGLQAKPELNGRRGVVSGFVAKVSRCVVRLDTTGDEERDPPAPIKIRPHNLMLRRG